MAYLAVYKSEKTPLGKFLEETKSILHTLAGHAQEIEKITRVKFQNSVDTMPKGTRDITLLYHQVQSLQSQPGGFAANIQFPVRGYRHTATTSVSAQTTTRPFWPRTTGHGGLHGSAYPVDVNRNQVCS